MILLDPTLLSGVMDAKLRPLLLAGLLLTLIGCGGGIHVRRVEAPALHDAGQASALSARQASPRTRQTLRQYDLDSLYPRDLDAISTKLHAFAVREPLPDLLFALSEVNYLRAERLHADAPRACSCYYLAAGYAWHFLFREGAPEAFDPRFRIACDLYNSSIARLVSAAQAVGQLDPRASLVLPGSSGQEGIRLKVRHHGFDYRAEEFGPVLLCSEFRVSGLTNHHRTYGLGVPLIGSRDPGARMPAHGFHPLRANFPVTAFFQYDGTLDDLAHGRAGCLELVNPLVRSALLVKGRRVPLESDLTTPLAYFLSNARLENAGIEGFLRPDSLGGVAGLHMLQPYRAGKIPVVLVHGLLSSPLTWAPMFNDLQADPVLRDRFQFWVYFYPTGNPYLVSAARLRDDLARARHALDPGGCDPALSEMVFVGHSMGGLISRLMTVNGGDDFWRIVSNSPFDSLKLASAPRTELRETFYFHRQPFVTRAIFLATPHHGSRLSPSPLGRLAARLAGVPRQVVSTFQDILAEDPDAFSGTKQLPNSVDLLAPDAPALQLIAARPRPPEVHYHSVIGVSPRRTLLVERLLGGGFKRPSDGVVPYDSAHLDSAQSELVVPADHFKVHQHALSILEVRRILLEHARDYDARYQTIQQVGAKTVRTSLRK